MQITQQICVLRSEIASAAMLKKADHEMFCHRLCFGVTHLRSQRLRRVLGRARNQITSLERKEMTTFFRIELQVGDSQCTA